MKAQVRHTSHLSLSSHTGTTLIYFSATPDFICYQLVISHVLLNKMLIFSQELKKDTRKKYLTPASVLLITFLKIIFGPAALLKIQHHDDRQVHYFL